jgi:hypothetical protein
MVPIALVRDMVELRESLNRFLLTQQWGSLEDLVKLLKSRSDLYQVKDPSFYMEIEALRNVKGEWGAKRLLGVFWESMPTAETAMTLTEVLAAFKEIRNHTVWSWAPEGSQLQAETAIRTVDKMVRAQPFGGPDPWATSEFMKEIWAQMKYCSRTTIPTSNDEKDDYTDKAGSQTGATETMIFGEEARLHMMKLMIDMEAKKEILPEALDHLHSFKLTNTKKEYHDGLESLTTYVAASRRAAAGVAETDAGSARKVFPRMKSQQNQSIKICFGSGTGSSSSSSGLNKKRSVESIF